MIFESIDYSFALQDFLFSIGAGFAVGFVSQLLSVFLYKNRVLVFIRDILVSFVFAVVIFSYVVSFTNYPIIRIYHIFGGLLGIFCFSVQFSTFFHKIFTKIFLTIKNKILCYGKKVYSIICDFKAKKQKKEKPPAEEGENEPLKTREVLVYNL